MHFKTLHWIKCHLRSKQDPSVVGNNPESRRRSMSTPCRKKSKKYVTPLLSLTSVKGPELKQSKGISKVEDVDKVCSKLNGRKFELQGDKQSSSPRISKHAIPMQMGLQNSEPIPNPHKTSKDCATHFCRKPSSSQFRTNANLHIQITLGIQMKRNACISNNPAPQQKHSRHRAHSSCVHANVALHLHEAKIKGREEQKDIKPKMNAEKYTNHKYNDKCHRESFISVRVTNSAMEARNHKYKQKKVCAKER